MYKIYVLNIRVYIHMYVCILQNMDDPRGPARPRARIAVVLAVTA